ncbi:Asparagine synthetase [glutamine-hydrolyzing] 1 [Thiorhodovibrio winogradskyi]|uniref:asparagine synthase (glutamine-hydrolyzing) n=1 Tax=Thiorhodovibrio winogradskyi TaxID=77007 RepID=A0ABZ0SBM8_9GAMM|nr:asparagine synthase (glutamine-hydrolyzing) [Thiorhodovibrio winogradskyi]
MCGLAFCYQDGASNTDLRERMRKAMARLAHRGPDGQGLYSGQAWAIGHRRLSIIDLAGSPQPMWDAQHRYLLSFNGEIYNYRALRQTLTAQWVFTTEGDTEVLLAGLVLEGERFLQRLEGMWAFALWDTQTETLLLSRDRMGKKPLYYFQQPGCFACASELPALRELALSPWSEDLDATADYFRYGFCLPGYTAWQGVYEVLPGHWLRWQPDSPIKHHAYWQLPTPGPDSPIVHDDDLRQVLTDAVARRLVADVEVGAFLSGGIDSSLVCALAQQQMVRPLKTYTIGFTEAAFDESAYAAQVAAHLGTHHHCELFQDWDATLLENLLRNHVGQPFADASLLPTTLVSQVAAREVKVALSGDGADELFGGYQRYQARLILRWYSRLPSGLRKLAEGAIRSLPEPTAHHSRSLIKKAHLFMDIAQRQHAEKPYIAPLMFPQEYAQLFPDLVGRGHCPHGLPEQTDLDDLQQMLTSDALIYLPQDILVKVDRASMAASLEVRAPFLDHKVVELAFARNASQHLKLGKGKRWLRRVFYNHLPTTTWQRRKQGFGVPVHQWFRSGMGEQLEANLTGNNGRIKVVCAQHLLSEHRHGLRDNSRQLWAISLYLNETLKSFNTLSLH